MQSFKTIYCVSPLIYFFKYYGICLSGYISVCACVCVCVCLDGWENIDIHVIKIFPAQTQKTNKPTSILCSTRIENVEAVSSAFVCVCVCVCECVCV